MISRTSASGRYKAPQLSVTNPAVVCRSPFSLRYCSSASPNDPADLLALPGGLQLDSPEEALVDEGADLFSHIMTLA